MPDFDRGFKTVARTAGHELARLAGVNCQGWKPIVSELQMVERLADRAFVARRGGQRFVVYLEAYTYWDRAAPWSVLAKAGLLSERERLPTVSLVFVLRPRGYQPQDGQLRLELGGEPTQQVWFREVCLWQLEPQPWWEDVPGLMALYPLSRHRRPPPDAIRHAAASIERHEAPPGERAELLTILNIFGKLVYPGVDVAGIIGREKMRESKFFEEVMTEGRVENARAYVLDVLAIRFGPEAAAEFAAAVNALDEPARLDELHRLAICCAGVEEFRAALAAPTPRRRKR